MILRIVPVESLLLYDRSKSCVIPLMIRDDYLSFRVSAIIIALPDFKIIKLSIEFNVDYIVNVDSEKALFSFLLKKFKERF